MRTWFIGLIGGWLLSILLFQVASKEIRSQTFRVPVENRFLTGVWVKPPHSVRDQGELVIASHGTNSHKEVFLPLGWALAQKGSHLLALDSPFLSTPEGIHVRVGEIAAGLHYLEKQQGRSFKRISLVGHSDGVLPSLALAAEFPDQRLGATVVLGSYLTKVLPGRVGVFVGGFDQVFPAATVKETFMSNAPFTSTFQYSWLSDHFTEQYDPILLERIAAFISGNVVPGGNWRTAFLLGIFGVSLVLALLAGFASASAATKWCYWFLLTVPVWILSDPLAKGGMLCLLVGSAIQWKTGWKVTRVALTFLFLMALNVIIFCPFFWQNFTAAAPWVFPWLPWYSLMWLTKSTLFFIYIVQSLTPEGLNYLPILILLLAGLAFVCPGWLSLFLKRFKKSPEDATAKPKAGRARDTKRLAVCLLVIMVMLWSVRFLQGMMIHEVFIAVTVNLIRTLLLPMVYLVLLATGRMEIGKLLQVRFGNLPSSRRK